MLPSTVNSLCSYDFLAFYSYWCLEGSNMYQINIWTWGINSAGHATGGDCWLKTSQVGGCEGKGQVGPCSGGCQSLAHSGNAPHLPLELPPSPRMAARPTPGNGQESQRALKLRQAPVLALPCLGTSLSWTLLELGVVTVLVLFYSVSVFLLIPSS